MTSKERVLLALDHQEADRVPLDIGGINNTCMHRIVEQRVKDYLHLEDHGLNDKCIWQGIVLPDPSIVDYFGVDTCSLYLNDQKPWQWDEEKRCYMDAWGFGWRENPDGLYYNMCCPPLADAETVDDILAFECPAPSEYMLEGLRERAEAHPDKALILEGLRSPIFNLPQWLRGEENFLCDLMDDDGMAECLMDKITDTYIELLDYVIDRIGDKLDIIKFADDMGSQRALLLSPETYRKHIKPHHERLFRHAKERTGCKILLHSCGAIRPLINDLIEIGVDALNPVQISAEGMDPAELKAEFGDRITFWGGGIDTQFDLPRLSPGQVEEAVRKNLEIFKPHGGYVFAPVHNIMPVVPTENVVAAYEAYRKYAGYGEDRPGKRRF